MTPTGPRGAPRPPTKGVARIDGDYLRRSRPPPSLPGHSRQRTPQTQQLCASAHTPRCPGRAGPQATADEAPQRPDIVEPVATPSASEADIVAVGRDLAAALPGDEPQPAEGDRRQGDGPRLAGRRAARGPVSLRRRRPRVPLARRPRAPPQRLPRRGRRPPAASPQVAMRMSRLEGRAPGARRRRGGRGQAHGAPLHRRRDAARGAPACSRTCGGSGVATSVDLLGEATITSRRGRPLRGALRRGARRARRGLPQAARAPGARGRQRRAHPAREPLGQGLRAHAAAAPRRAGARQARRRRAPARAPAPRARARRAPAHRHGVLRLARGDHRPRARAALRGRVRATAPRPASSSRPTCATARELLRAMSSPGRRATAARLPAARAPGQGRLLGPRDRRGAPARLGVPVFEVKADCDRNFEALTRRLLDARPAVRVADRLAQPALDRPRRRRQPRHGRRRRATSRSRSCAAWATTSRRRWPKRGLRVRTYCPVGDLVAGMAYLVRRLLENTSNESFLHEQARGPLARRAAAPRHERPADLRQRADRRAAPRDGARRAAARAWRSSSASCP